MEDEKIIQLYHERKEEAVKLTNQKYGAYLYSVARRIVQDEGQAQKCVNDALVLVWLSIPPKSPACLKEYVTECTLKVAKEYARQARSKKRIHKKKYLKKQEHLKKQVNKKQVNLKGQAHPQACQGGRRVRRLAGCLKYIPVAACIGIVLFVSAYLAANLKLNLNRGRTDFFLSASDGRAEGNLDLQGPDAGGFNPDNGQNTGQNTGQNINQNMDQDTDQNIDQNMDQNTDQNNSQNTETYTNTGQKKPTLPPRFDPYEGPVLAMTATGDTQHVKTTRKLRGKVTAQYYNGAAQPIFQAFDHYQIKNTSNEDKTLQLVYPFAATLNLSYGLDGSILKVHGQGQDISYGIGDGISAFLGGGPKEEVTMGQYELLSDPQKEYQENALQKAVDWNREVSVYFFTDIQAEEGSGGGVVGVTVAGPDADVLTYGFDYAAESAGEDGASANYCFFATTEYARPMLIVSGRQEGEPKIGYYTNLDCEDGADGIQCTVQKRLMPYSDALRLCSREAARKMKYAYDGLGQYTGKLPEYFDEDAVYKALTVVSTEDDFYDTLVRRYGNIELEEVFESMYQEVRIVYAMVTVTIPAKKTIKATARVQKRQMDGNYTMAWDSGGGDTPYRYDLAGAWDSRLNVKKTVFELQEPKLWKVVKEDLGFKRDGSSFFASFQKGGRFFIIS